MLKNLQDYQWQQRLVVVFSAIDSIATKQFIASVRDQTCAVSDRHISIVLVDTESAKSVSVEQIPVVTLNEPSIRWLSSRRRYPAAAFEMMLIGKDGGIKGFSDDSNQLIDFLHQIDGMPMRQQEARATKGTNQC